MKKALLLLPFLLAFGLWYFSPQARLRRALRQEDYLQAADIITARLEKSPPPARERDLREQLCRIYVDHGAYEPAERELAAFRRKFPEDFWAARTLGFLLAELGRHRDGRRELQAAQVLKPDDPMTVYGLAFLDYVDWDFPSAEKRLQALLKVIPEDAVARELLGQIYLTRGRYKDAYRELETAKKGFKSNQKVLSLLFACAVSMEEWDKAKALIAEVSDPVDARVLTANLAVAQGKWDEADAIVAKIYNEKPRIDTGIGLARIWIRRGKLKDAALLWRSFGEELPSAPGPSPTVTAASLDEHLSWKMWAEKARKDHALLGATLAIAENRLEDAQGYARQAMTLSPKAYECFAMMADLARIRNEPEERLRWIQKAVVLYFDHPQTLMDRSEALLAIGRTKEAVDDVRSVLEEYPNFAHAHAILAESFLKSGDAKTALASAQKSVELAPLDSYGYMILGLAQWKDGQGRAAESSLARALELAPSNARAHAEFAEFLRTTDRLAVAKKHEREALRLEPMVYGRLKNQ